MSELAKGVAFNAPPPHLMADALRIVNETAAQLPAGANGGLTFIGSKNPGEPLGINAALVVKAGEHFKVVSWIGKKWGEELSAGFGGQVLW